jgi:hydrogenase nickel incorporation protein HypA/HybF
MHEMSLMEGLLQRATDSLAPYRVEKVNRLIVRAGVLANIMPAAFEFAFEALSADTVFAGAELSMEKLPIEALCSGCGKTFTSETLPLICPECAKTASKIISGSEVYLASIDFEEEGEDREN